METNFNEPLGQIKSLAREKVIRRPLLLRVLCIWAGVLSGVVMCLSFFIFSFSDELAGMIIGYNIGIDDFFAGDNLVFSSAISLVLSAVALCAVVKMWRLEKFGFWMFCVVQLVALVARFSILGVLVKIVLILLFYRNYKYMAR